MEEARQYQNSCRSGRCFKCGSTFSCNKRSARIHMRNEHGTYKCDECNKRFFLQQAVDQHQKAKGHTGGVLNGAYGGKDHDSFMQKYVIPDKTHMTKSREVVNKLKTFLEHNTRFSVNKLFVGGSQGKKTNILDHSDVDLVMYSNDYDTMEEFQNELPKDLRTLATHLKRDLNGADADLTITHHGVLFEVQLPGYKPIKVDLLPALDVLSTKTLPKIHGEMKTKSEDDRAYYSVCLSQEQTEFVKCIPDEVKNLIRLVKHWKTTENVPAKSYFLELLVIHLWEALGKPAITGNSREKILKDVITKLTKLSSMRILWNFKSHGAQLQNPVLLDPVNPYQNVAPDVKDVPEIERKARSYISKIM